MPMYQYRCPACRAVHEKFAHHTDEAERLNLPLCPNCHIRMKRVFGFAKLEEFEPHFNHSVGAYVTSKRDMMDKLKAGAAERSERLGIPHDYSLIDRADVSDSDVGVDEAGMRETHDRHVELGMKPPTGRITF